MPTDKERMDAFTACFNKGNQDGLSFVVNVISGNVGGALGDWADEILHGATNNNGCFQLLTPEQRQQVYQAIKAQMDMDKFDREPN